MELFHAGPVLPLIYVAILVKEIRDVCVLCAPQSRADIPDFNRSRHRAVVDSTRLVTIEEKLLREHLIVFVNWHYFRFLVEVINRSHLNTSSCCSK